MIGGVPAWWPVPAAALPAFGEVLGDHRGAAKTGADHLQPDDAADPGRAPGPSAPATCTTTPSTSPPTRSRAIGFIGRRALVLVRRRGRRCPGGPGPCCPAPSGPSSPPRPPPGCCSSTSAAPCSRPAPGHPRRAQLICSGRTSSAAPEASSASCSPCSSRSGTTCWSGAVPPRRLTAARRHPAHRYRLDLARLHRRRHGRVCSSRSSFVGSLHDVRQEEQGQGDRPLRRDEPVQAPDRVCSGRSRLAAVVCVAVPSRYSGRRPAPERVDLGTLARGARFTVAAAACRCCSATGSSGSFASQFFPRSPVSTFYPVTDTQALPGRDHLGAPTGTRPPPPAWSSPPTARIRLRASVKRPQLHRPSTSAR